MCVVLCATRYRPSGTQPPPLLRVTGFVAKANFTDPDGDYDEEQLAAFRREKEAIQKKKEEE